MKKPMFGYSICNSFLKSFTLSIILCFQLFRLSAQGGEIVSDIFVSEKDTLPFQFISPGNTDTMQKYPLVIWLHGKGERGTDNKKQMTLIKKWLPDSLQKDKYKSFLLAPQCSEDRYWSNYDKLADKISFDSITPEIQITLMKLIDSIMVQYPIDPNRIYIMGISMGGFGAFDLITRYPDFFAAAVPICGGADPRMADEISKTPVWAFHGDKDNVVNKRHSVLVMKSVEDANHKFTLYSETGHDCWNKSFKEPLLLQWMFYYNKE